jgi:hypothetical protein
MSLTRNALGRMRARVSNLVAVDAADITRTAALALIVEQDRLYHNVSRFEAVAIATQMRCVFALQWRCATSRAQAHDVAKVVLLGLLLANPDLLLDLRVPVGVAATYRQTACIRGCLSCGCARGWSSAPLRALA